MSISGVGVKNLLLRSPLDGGILWMSIDGECKYGGGGGVFLKGLEKSTITENNTIFKVKFCSSNS